MTNKGNTELPFSWQVVMEEEAAQQKTVSFADGEQLRLPSRCSTAAMDAGPDVYPFTVDPEVGSIAAGKKQNFQVKFAPLDIKDYEGRLICRYEANSDGPKSLSPKSKIGVIINYGIQMPSTNSKLV